MQAVVEPATTGRTKHTEPLSPYTEAMALPQPAAPAVHIRDKHGVPALWPGDISFLGHMEQLPHKTTSSRLRDTAVLSNTYRQTQRDRKNEEMDEYVLN